MIIVHIQSVLIVHSVFPGKNYKGKATSVDVCGIFVVKRKSKECCPPHIFSKVGILELFPLMGQLFYV